MPIRFFWPADPAEDHHEFGLARNPTVSGSTPRRMPAGSPGRSAFTEPKERRGRPGLAWKSTGTRSSAPAFSLEEDPIARGESVYAEMHRIMAALNEMPIVKVRVEAAGTDLIVAIGENRRWLGGRGRNIPSFELFTSPDWRGVEGRISFDLPLLRYGQIVRDISLEIEARENRQGDGGEERKALHEMIAQSNADKIGEFSLTDRRFSRITKFMAETLFDENFGGEFGNTHLAIGKAYHDACSEDAKKIAEEDFDRLGFNDSPEHTDMIATTDRTVTATLPDGSKKVIYEGGEFKI